MSGSFNLVTPLSGASFGGLLSLLGEAGAHRFIEAAERDPVALPRALADSQGLLLLPGMEAMVDEPALLARLSRLFGPEVENYREILTPLNTRPCRRSSWCRTRRRPAGRRRASPSHR